MRPLILNILCFVACVGCGGRNDPGQRAPAAPAPKLEPAPAPAEAFERATRAMAEGDEAAYRRVVLFRPPSTYAEAESKAHLAAARLHKAVRERGVTGRRVRDAGFDRDERLIAVAPPTGEQLEQGLKIFRDMGWKVEGDVARPAAGAGADNQPRVERTGDGWVVVVSNSSSLPDDDPNVRKMAESAASNAEVFDAATAAVKAGKLRTVREVNDFVDQERKAIARREVERINQAAPTGPVVVVTDAETGKPVGGATVSARVVVPPGKYRPISATTDAQGRARLPAEPHSIHDIGVEAMGYARRDQQLEVVPGREGRPGEVHLKVGKAAVVQVMLVLPDERRAAISVYEGDEGEAAEAGMHDKLEPGHIRVPVKWGDEPPPLPEHNPMIVLRFDTSPHRGKTGIVHRVTHAQTATGRELPVFRDVPPNDPQTFGLYQIGRDAFGSTVFVIGTLDDARETAAKAGKTPSRLFRNDRVLGPGGRRRATSPGTKQ